MAGSRFSTPSPWLRSRILTSRPGARAFPALVRVAGASQGAGCDQPIRFSTIKWQSPASYNNDVPAKAGMTKVCDTKFRSSLENHPHTHIVRSASYPLHRHTTIGIKGKEGSRREIM